MPPLYKDHCSRCLKACTRVRKTKGRYVTDCCQAAPVAVEVT